MLGLASKFGDEETGNFEKMGHFVKNWKLRHFKLDMVGKRLMYYVDRDDSNLKGEYFISSKSKVAKVPKVRTHVLYSSTILIFFPITSTGIL